MPADPTEAEMREAWEALRKWGEARRRVRWGDWAGDSHVRCDDAREACERLADSLAARAGERKATDG